MDEIIAAIGNETRRAILKELEYRGTISFTQLKEILYINNDRTLNHHLSKLQKSHLVMKSPHAHGYQLTTNGLRILEMIKNFEGQPENVKGNTVRVHLKGRIDGDWGLSSVLTDFREHPCLRLEVSTEKDARITLRDKIADVRLDVNSSREFTVIASIPMMRLLSMNKANDVKPIEEGFKSLSSMFESQVIEQNEDAQKVKIPSWVLMAMAIVWVPIFFLFATLTKKTQSLNLSILNCEANLV